MPAEFNVPQTSAIEGLVAAKIGTGGALDDGLGARLAARVAGNVSLVHGATGGGVANDAAAFQAAALAAKNAARDGTAGGSVNDLGSYVIELPAGDFRIEDVEAMLGDEAMASPARGLVIRGQGSGVTNIVFAPSVAGALMANDYWQGIRVSGVRFIAETAGCTFMESYTTNSAQDYTFTDVSWIGWKYVFDLQGDDNNSEFRFFSCATSAIETGGAFLYIGAASTSDQFLNYWFYGFKHWSTSAPIIDAAKGGSFHMYGIDVSGFANGETTTYRPIIALRGVSHSQGVCSVSVDGLRVEGKSNYAQLLYTEWPQGTITMRGVDFTSQSTSYTWDRMVHVKYSNVNGAILTFESCMFANGKFYVGFTGSDWSRKHRIALIDCEFGSASLTPTEAVTYDTSLAGGFTGYPLVEFRGCRGGYTDPSSANGGSVWDASVGWMGERVIELPQRKQSVRSVNGAPWTTAAGAMKINLPVGALITGLRVLLPAGELTSGVTGSTWTLATTEGSPTTLATVTAPGALSAGVDQFAAISPPYKASARDKATVTVTPTGIDQNARNGVVVIEGYW